MPKFRKKPVVIEAEQFLEGTQPTGVCRCIDHPVSPHVHTIHAGQICAVDYKDWIIAEADGIHFYPCKPDIFAATYEPA